MALCSRSCSTWCTLPSSRHFTFRLLQQAIISRNATLSAYRQFSSSSSSRTLYMNPCRPRTYYSISKLLNVSSRSFSEGSTNPPAFSKKRSAIPLMLLSTATVVAVVIGAYLFSEYQKERIERERKELLENAPPKTSKGKALIGGPFTLVNTDGETVTEKNYLGKWLLIYFGFTFCPDICPEELEKIGEIIDIIDNEPSAPQIQPIFISVDPKRDTPELIKSYLDDFHPRFIGLTGSTEQVKRATKSYRVYYSEGPDQAPGAMEYIVDHSIVTFLVNPDGQFCKNFGQRATSEDAAAQIAEKINEFYSLEE